MIDHPIFLAVCNYFLTTAALIISANASTFFIALNFIPGREHYAQLVKQFLNIHPSQKVTATRL